MAFQQPPFKSAPLSANGQMTLAWTQWFQQVQASLSSQGSPALDGGTPSSIYGGNVSSIDGGTVTQPGSPV